MEEDKTIFTDVIDEVDSKPPLINPFDLYLQREDGDVVFFEGDYISFNGQTGKWTRGSDKKPINATTQFLCNINEIYIGWLKFADGKTERHVGRIVDGYVRLPREKLGDLDQRIWPLNRRGEREDPWKKVTYLQMRCQEDGEPVVFGPFSDTARRAIKSFVAICRRTDRGGKLPVVLLGNRSFQYQSGGTTYVPDLKIVGWEFLDGQPVPEPQLVPLPATPATAKLAAPVDVKRDGIDDEIPF
jgi:hypothetical protein